MKRALTIGINYPGQASELKGCVEDSHTIIKLLKEKFGFIDSEITQILDNDATTDRMKSELIKLVNGAMPGDILFFHYSGHGSQIINDNPDVDHEEDGLDEILCPVDFDWKTKFIRDDFLKYVFNFVPRGVNLTVFLDCCNSGGGVDAAEQYKPDIGKIDSMISGRYVEPPADVKEYISLHPYTPPATRMARSVDSTCMVIAGAQSHQTAADARIDGVYQGATTYALNRALDELGVSATYYQIIYALNKFMVDNRFTQRPQLDGPWALHHWSFLSAYDFGVVGTVATVTPQSQPSIAAVEPSSGPTVNTAITVDVGSSDSSLSGNKTKLLVVGVLLVVAALVAFLI